MTDLKAKNTELEAKMKKIKVDVNAPAAGDVPENTPIEQNQQLGELKEEISDLKAKNTALEQKMDKSEGDINVLKEENARLKVELGELKKSFFQKLGRKPFFKGDEEDAKDP